MMGLPNGVEWIIILIIIILLFGPGRIGKTLGELGSGLRSFKNSLTGEKKDDEEAKAAAEEKKSS